MIENGWLVEESSSKSTTKKSPQIVKNKKQLSKPKKPTTTQSKKPNKKSKNKKLDLSTGGSDDEEEIIRHKSEIIKVHHDQLFNVESFEPIENEENSRKRNKKDQTLTKSQKRKLNKQIRKKDASTTDEEWMALSTQAPPPLPKTKSITGKEIMWQNVDTDLVDDGFDDGLEGFLGLEVADGIDCNWEEHEGVGKLLKFHSVGEIKKRKLDDDIEDAYEMPLDEEDMKGFVHVDSFVEDGEANDDDDESEEELEEEDDDGESDADEVESEVEEDLNEDEESEDEVDDEIPALVDIPSDELEEIQEKLGDWIHFELHDNIMRGLLKLNFLTPTQVQKDTLIKSLHQKRDIIASAETGSGKTLSFGLPILQRIAEVDLTDSVNKKVYGLILAPTRELALQISQHLKSAGQYIPKFYVGTIVGGLSAQKQNRVLTKIPHILVATPGRLWDLVSNNPEYLKHIRQTEFLVLDEADRMLQKGRFKEVQQLLPMLDKPIDNMPKPKSRQTFIFSATLPAQVASSSSNKKFDKSSTGIIGIQDLLKNINFRDSKPFHLNLTKNDQGLASKLIESRVDCLLKDKFLYLYYLLLRYPGRTICFVNSIDTIRRLTPQLELLGIKAFPLHAQMQQKQRLKNVDRFKTLDNVVLVASDVAARGLDIPLVDHVIHFQLPRTVELYIHRSGRTARGTESGISIMLCCPEEFKSYTMVCRHLQKERVDHFDIDGLLVKKLKPRVQLAQEIDQMMHKGRKEKANRSWIEQQAEKMDIVLDEDFVGKVKQAGDHQEQDAVANRKVAKLKDQLKTLLGEKIMAIGHSSKFITKFNGSNADLIQNLSNETSAFRGAEKRSALKDAKKRKLKK